MEAAGLAVGVAALFTTCNECLDIVFAAQNFARDFEVLNTAFQQQRLRFSLWGEGHLLRRFKVYDAKYGLRNNATLSLINVSGQLAFEDTFSKLTSRDQKQKSFRAVTKWAVFDGEKIKDTVNSLQELIDGLVAISEQLETLRGQSDKASDSARCTLSVSVNTLCRPGAAGLERAPSGVSRQMEAPDLPSSMETFFTATSALTLPFEYAPIKAPAEGNTIGGHAIIQASVDDDNSSSPDSISTYESTASSNASNVFVREALGQASFATMAATEDILDSPWTATVIPTTPRDFADMFLTTSTIFIRHAEAAALGNLNLEIFTSGCDEGGGKRRYLCLFHLRMHDLSTRKFSLRRYCRNSGREVCHSLLKKPVRSRIRRSYNTISRRSSGIHSTGSDIETAARDLRGTSRSSRTSIYSWFKRRSSRSSHLSGGESDLEHPEDEETYPDVSATKTSRKIIN
ncbi:hypothetical protein EK21DRAFT_90255 [Setomelanomma holmii]|uniref:Prion-inhibition and propagation HeLo domain-containing protein n=1 Tax=Setomelanomma holmii TaxID=210430 RepID=A0A9P4LL58_9PLEO|nr:hypothetical protein EK21DRAFT_90255 [Setomelanomma holmii]